MYTGDFLSGVAWESWVAPMNTWYRSLYIELCKSLAEHLMEKMRFLEVVTLCKKALYIDKLAQELHLQLIRALTLLNQPQQALKHCEYFKKVCFE